MRACVILGVMLLLGGCQPEVYRYAGGTVYGTYYRVAYEAPEELDSGIVAQLERVNASLSMFDASSVISRLNHNESKRVDSLFVRMFTVARRVNQETKGAFDITVAPLVNAWGFGYKKGELPAAGRIDTLRQWVGMEKLRLEGDSLQKQWKETEMDASSIAKGLGVDLVAEYLESEGVRNYMVDIGGEVRVKGKSDKKRAWRIGIDKPEDNPDATDRELQLVVALEKGALATSGNYRNFYVREGKKYAHTISPATGYPVQQDVVSSTVYASACMEADAYATSFMVLGLQASRDVIAANPDIEACLIYTENDTLKVWMTDKFKTFIVK